MFSPALVIASADEEHSWGDCGPNKFSATANCMLLYGDHYNQPEYTLYQRDREDVAEPLSMMWYNPQTTGDFWAGLALDHYFPDAPSAWAAMRGSWTDSNQIYAASASSCTLAGDWVECSCLAQSRAAVLRTSRLTPTSMPATLSSKLWVSDGRTSPLFELLSACAKATHSGELCHDDYLNPEYFSSEAQGATRWLYYRCRTEGQNTLVYNAGSGPLFGNQVVTGTPSNSFGSTGDAQDSLGFTAPTTSAGFFITDLSSAYAGANVQRGMRLLNGRRQMLLRDELTGNGEVTQWRMQYVAPFLRCDLMAQRCTAPTPRSLTRTTTSKRASPSAVRPFKFSFEHHLAHSSRRWNPNEHRRARRCRLAVSTCRTRASQSLPSTFLRTLALQKSCSTLNGCVLVTLLCKQQHADDRTGGLHLFCFAAGRRPRSMVDDIA